MLIVAFLLQAAAPSVPDRHSVLVPVASQPCVRKDDAEEVVVCADPLPAQVLPLPSEAISTRSVPVNRDMTGVGALNAAQAPCATIVGGCNTGLNILGMGVAAVRGVQKLVAPGSCCEREGEATNPFMLVGDAVKGVAKAGKQKPDRTKRVAIDLEDPVLAGRVHP
ncbi:hypothetical protein QP166_15510 [Sphingomonas sp. LR60]|uniref:hypothetical protein n=1 Tax=Sphingomonas sp. LR60 TaxID=3050233 RepID=UPI002FE3E921